MVAPYWQSPDGALTIYHGDARDVLPALDLSAVDLVLTDPPYGIDGGVGDGARNGKGKYLATNWSDTSEYITEVCAQIIRDCIAAMGRCIITPGKYHMWQYPQPDDLGDFFVPMARGRGRWGFNTTNPILYYGRSPRLGKGDGSASLMMTGHGDCCWHPCAKPLDAWQWLLCKGSLEGETVLDPFAGAFTTLLAAQRTGRKAIGIEIEEYYCERGVERLLQAPMPIGATETKQEVLI